MNYEVSLVLAAIASVVLTVLLYVKVMPRKLDGSFTNPLLQFIHDYFHFKKLYLEEVLPCIENGLCAAIYTQVSDVEDEINGLVSYDRKVEKLKPEVMVPVA